MSPGPAFLMVVGAVVVLAVMVVLWFVQRRTGDAGIVDAGWAGSLAFLGILFALGGGGDPARRLLLGLMTGLWGGRLALHLLHDRILGKPEDGRYRRMREERGAGVQGFFLVFFLAQGFFALLLSLPFLLAALDRRPPGAGALAALLLWLGGWIGETVADRQLARFRNDPANRGRTCRTGLWRWSRHPNYFFEWLIWCSFALLALGAPFGWLGLLSPLIMLGLILFVTGIPPTEAQALRSRGDDYRRYQAVTSPFVPWPPRREGP